MDINIIKELMEALEKSSLTSLEVEESGMRISLKKERAVITQAQAIQAAPVSVPAVPAVEATESLEGIEIVKAPLVGTLYRAKSENDDPFVKVGSKVKAGDVLCLIEAMKMFSEIKAPCDGEVTAIHFDNGQLAEYDQEVVYIKKA